MSMKQSLWLSGVGATAFHESFQGLFALLDLMKTYIRRTDVGFGWDINAIDGPGFPMINFQNRLFSSTLATEGEPRVRLHPTIDPTGNFQRLWEGNTLKHVEDNVVRYYERFEDNHTGRLK